MYTEDQMMRDYIRLREEPENKKRVNSSGSLLSAMNVVLMDIWADKQKLKQITR